MRRTLKRKESDRPKAQLPMSLANWKPPSKRTYEDELLLKYWQKANGVIFTEVLVGRGGRRQWPDSAKPRRIDGIRIVSSAYKKIPSDIVTFDKRANAQEFEQIITGAKVEVIEVKYSLDRVVLGQVIVGADLLEMEYAPVKINQVVVCEVGDPVLEIVCKKRGIKIWTPAKAMMGAYFKHPHVQWQRLHGQSGVFRIQNAPNTALQLTRSASLRAQLNATVVPLVEFAATHANKEHL